MTIKLFLLFFSAWTLVKNVFLDQVSHRHDKKPLPEEVCGIYDADRYQSYLQRKHEYRVVSLMEGLIHLIADMIILFSPFYRMIEQLSGGNVYFITILTIVFLELISTVISTPFSYYETFVIEEKYGLNKTTKKEFFKDTLVDDVVDLVSELFLYFIIVWICRAVGGILLKTAIGYGLSSLIVFAVIGVLVLCVLLLALFQLLNLRLKYRFMDLPEGELRDKINAMTKDSKKKIRRICVYNESSKSVEKNAFLLKFLWYREFGIADNFLDGNSEEELLAVLAHETGHLKYKERIYDYLNHVFSLVLVCGMVWLLANISVLQQLDLAIRSAFDLTITNYVLSVSLALHLLKPYLFLSRTYGNYLSRKHEYDADAYCASLGYAEPLKHAFMKLSSDELININPSPLIEFLDYDHPSMYRRIKAINEQAQIYAQSHQVGSENTEQISS